MCNRILKWDFLHLHFSWGSRDQELDAVAKCFPIPKQDAKWPHSLLQGELRFCETTSAGAGLHRVELLKGYKLERPGRKEDVLGDGPVGRCFLLTLNQVRGAWRGPLRGLEELPGLGVIKAYKYLKNLKASHGELPGSRGRVRSKGCLRELYSADSGQGSKGLEGRRWRERSLPSGGQAQIDRIWWRRPESQLESRCHHAIGIAAGDPNGADGALRKSK